MVIIKFYGTLIPTLSRKKELLMNRYRETAHIPEPCGHCCRGIDKGHCTRFLGSWSISTDSVEASRCKATHQSWCPWWSYLLMRSSSSLPDKRIFFKLGESSVGTVCDKDDRLLGGLCWNSPENPKKSRHHCLHPLHALSFTSFRCGLAMPR